MAETAVNIVIDKLIPLLSQEVSLLGDVHAQITSIKDELELIRAYLKDADQKAEMAITSNAVTEWVKQMRQVSYRIEDVIDEYLLKVAKRGLKHGFVGVLSKTSHMLKSIIPRHNITSEIGSIKESIDRLYERRETLELNSVSYSYDTGISTRRLDALYTEDDQLVGVDKTREILTGWLLGGESKRTLISVVGEGGLGKTTIVNNVYKKQKEKISFDCYAWITVTRSLKGEKLLKVMKQSFYKEENNKSAAERIKNETMDKNTLIKELREYLQGRSYMIVFDDVWDIDFWEGVEFALLDNNKRSRIMITTRDRGVAEFCTRFAHIHIYELKPLPLDDALKLFYLKAFQFDLQDCPNELIGLSQDFVKKCNGVPLAIVAIAGLLSTKKKNVFEWSRIHNSLRSKLANDPHLRSFYQVLSKSYNDLPYQLKLCLLYFGLFPEDYSIRYLRLISLWVAEGFVKAKDNEDHTLDEIAKEYLDELIRRSLVKVWNVYPYRGIRSYCRVHDLMHDFIVKKCKDLNFCQVIKSERFSFHPWTRRLSIQTHNIDDNFQGSMKYGRVRSCFCINLQELPMSLMESLLSRFKLLIALDFEDAPLDYLPEVVGNLLLLKYLNLRSTKIKTIPKFIGMLLNLETLDLKHTLVHEFPEDIFQLVKLRLLIAYTYHWENNFLLTNVFGMKLTAGIGHLKALQRLSFVDTTDGDGVIKELINLKDMRKLGITNLSKNNGKLLCNAIQGMKYLCSLNIEAVEEIEVLDLHSITDPPQYLQRLYLAGRLERLPDWISKLKNLTQLHLICSELKEDPLFILKDLPELMTLQLHKSYEGDELHFRNGWFKKLKWLGLVRMQRLRSLKIDEGALPLLKELGLLLFPQMVEVPVDIQNLKTLKYLLIREVPDQFINDMKGKCFNIFNHIPEVIYWVDGESFFLH